MEMVLAGAAAKAPEIYVRALNAGTQRTPQPGRIRWGAGASESQAQGGISQITACDPCMRFWKLRSRSYATMRSDGARQGWNARVIG